VEANPRLESARDCAAIERGPPGYCLEQCDSAEAPILAVQFDTTAPLESDFRPDLLGGVSIVARRASLAGERHGPTEVSIVRWSPPKHPRQSGSP
jgi:hypothetical protein